MHITEYAFGLNKNGNIVVLDNSKDNAALIGTAINEAGHKNKVVLFDDAEAAGHYLRENQKEVFMVLQNNATPAIQLPDSRNMVYMNEKFKSNAIPYMFLVLTEHEKPTGRHTFIHCYYKTDEITGLSETLTSVVDFWKDHVFPPRVNYYQQ
ncbi:hypothetical protein GR160_09100 [Flavobacterium sp. Sd200]|uniref:hypothetical protein n=1 Tax=Flavobacterium sp. Sd200 TaxID=2692211 RepID=UPI001371B368|nr:hypothetical protein [Flavobacterium sp. Sd200]MXN91385.1 hypothetical protein [Flavobacterium sp. Sd200]